MANEATAALIARLRSRPVVPGGLAERRAAMDAMAMAPAKDVLVERVTCDGVPAEWVSVPDPGAAVVLYLHGGGYVIGSPASHRELAGRIARAAAARLLVLDYRLAPEHPFPAAVEDAVTAYRWLLAQGVQPARIVIAGDSAGGGLTLAALISLRDAGDPLPAAGVTLSAWTDLALTGDSITTRAQADPIVGAAGIGEMAAAYAAGIDTKHPLVSPLYADLAGLPPLLMQVGDAETLLDDSMRVAEHAQAAGVDVTLEVYPEMIHVFQAFAGLLPEGEQAIARIGAFVNQRTAAPASA